MKPSDIGSLIAAGSPAISPDGRRVAFVVRRADVEHNKYRSQIWLAPADGSAQSRPLTDGEHGDSDPAWSPDGAHLAFVSHRAEKPSSTTIHVMPMDGPGETHMIAQMKDSAGGLRWSPDGRWLAFTARTPSDRYKETDDAKQPPRKIETFFTSLNGEGWVYDRPNHVYAVPSDGSCAPENLTPGDREFGAAVWLSDSSGVVCSGADHATWDRDLAQDLFLVSLDGTRERITEQTGLYAAQDIRGDQLAFVGQDDSQLYPQNTKVGVFNLTTRQRRWVSESVDRPFETTSAGQCVRWADDSTLLTLGEDRGDAYVYSISLADATVRPITPADAVITGFACASGVVAFGLTSIEQPSEIFVGGLAGEAPRRLSDVSGRFTSRVRPQRAERFIATSTGGTEVDAWILTPADFDPATQYPVLLNVHGGPFTQYGNGFFDEAQMQAGAGFVVLMSNPRGGSGRDTAWAQAILGPKHPTRPGTGWGSVDVEDVLAVLDEALRRYPFCDPNRVGMLGGSYGGYMATMLAAKHGSRFGAICSERAVNNLLSEEWNSDIATMFRVEHGPDHVSDPLEYSRMSPSSFVHDINTPMLLIHSENDLRCPIVQAEELFVALRMLGRDVEFYRFPDESHELSRSGSPIHRTQRAELILEYFGRKLANNHPV